MAKQDVELKFSLIDGVSRGLAQIQQGVSGLGASLVKVNAAAELTGKAFGAIKTAGSFLADQVTSVGNFESSLASLQAVTGASAEELVKLKDAAVLASQASIFSSTQAADGLTELARAGFSATDSISSLNPVLALAQGQQLAVGEAAQFVTTTLTQFGLAATDAGRVADVLASAADKSSTDVRQLGQALSYTAPVASQLGLSLEETTAIIGKLADAGFRGERGGTALANVFTALVDPSSKFSKALDDAGIKTRDFNGVMQALADKGDGATKILLELDTTARPAITALTKQGSAGIRELTAALLGSNDAAQRTADILGATFNATVQKFQNNIENLRNAVLAPILAPLADEVQALSDRLISFSQTPEFDVIVANFTKIATAGIQGFGDFIASVDFSEVLQKTIDFTTSVAENLGTISKALEITGRTLGGFGDIASITFQSLKGVTADVAAAIIEPLAVFNGEAEGIWLSLKKQAADSERSVGASLKSLGARFAGAGDSAKGAAGWVESFGSASQKAKDRYEGLAKSLIPAPLLAVANAAAEAALEIEKLRVPPEAARLSLGDLAKGADSTALSLNALQERLKAVRDALENAPRGSPEFIRLAQDAAKLEEEIKRTKDAIDEASGANERLANSANNAANALSNQAGAAREVDQTAKSVADGVSQADASLANVSQTADQTSLVFTNLSEKLRSALSSAIRYGTDTAGLIRSINEIGRAQEEGNRRVEEAIRLREMQNPQLQEERRLREALINKYGVTGDRIERLLQLRLNENRERERAIELTRQEIAQERERAGIAGGIGTQRGPAADAGTAATGGKGTGDGAGRGGQVININVQGLPTDRDSWRGIVRDLIEPELRNLRALSK